MHRIFCFRPGGPRGSRLLLVFALAVELSGCASFPETASPPEHGPLGMDLEPYEAPTGLVAGELSLVLYAPGPVAVPEAVGALTLRDSLALALRRNPGLASFSWEVRVREAEALQAGLFPNPELGVEVENFAGSGDFGGFDGTETTVALGQLVELAGKRLKRRRVAELERDLAGWDYEVRRIEVFTEVVQSFVAVTAAQERLTLAEELLRIADEARASVAKQVRAGAASAVERTRAEVAASTAQVELRTATAELAAARSRLAAAWGSTQPKFERVDGDLYTVRPPPSLDLLVARIGQNPDLARWVQEVELRRAVVAL